MPEYAPILKGGMNLARLAAFANSPNVTGGIGLGRAAIPYLFGNNENAALAANAAATGQQTYSALSGGMSKPVTIGGTNLGITGGQLSGIGGIASTTANMMGGKDDPESVGMGMMGSYLMMTGNPYLQAAGAVMVAVSPYLSGTDNPNPDVSGTATAKWGDTGLMAPEVYSNASTYRNAEGKEGNMGGYVTALGNMPEQEGTNPTWKQLGLSSPDQMTSEYFDTQIAKKQQEIAEAQTKMKQFEQGNPYDYTTQADLGTYSGIVNNLNTELKDLQSKKSQYEAMAPYAVQTPKGNAYNINDLSELGVPYASMGAGAGEISEPFSKGVQGVTQAAMGQFNKEVQAVLSQMPEEQRNAVMGKLKEIDFTIDYDKLWKKEGTKAGNLGQVLPERLSDLGMKVYDQLWGTVEQEFGVSRDDILPLIQVEQPANLAGASYMPTLAGKTFGTGA